MPELLPKPKDCLGCTLHDIGKGFINPEGTGSIPLLMIGESPGWNEIVQGLPFRPDAQAGSILHRVIRDRAKFTRSQFAFSNLIQCRPPADHLTGSSYEYESINHCRAYLDRIIDKYKPKCILALGGLPFKHLVGLEGKNLNISQVRGYVFEGSRYTGIPVVSTYHPSYIRRGNSHLTGTLIVDFLKAVGIAQGKKINYIMDPIVNASKEGFTYYTKADVSQALQLLTKVRLDSNLTVSYDIETKESAGKEEDEIEEYGEEIKQIQFSINKKEGWAFPFEEPFIGIAKSIMKLNNPKLGWNNWDFDDPRLRRAGFVIGGRIDDGMQMQHHYDPDIPLGLQHTASYYNFPFPWKHLAGEDLAFYGIADTDAPLWIMEVLKERMVSKGLWKGYNELVYRFKPILLRISERGYPVNREKQKKFSLEIEIEKKKVLGEILESVPKSMTKYHPKEGYKVLPREYKHRMMQFCVDNKWTLDLINLPSPIIAEQVGLVVREFNGVKRYCKELVFNPNGAEQTSDLIKAKGYEGIARKLAVKIAKSERLKAEGVVDPNKKGKDNLSTAKGVLKVLAEKTNEFVFKKVVEYRELSKMEGTYVGDKSKWVPKAEEEGGDGRVHTTFTLRPATPQTSSRNPNIQQDPQHTSLADRFQETIEAKEGNVLIKCDYKSFHAKMLGFLAEDRDYIRLSSIDPHSYVASHMAQLPEANECIRWDDEKLITFLKVVKKEHKALRDDQAKHAILGIGFGLSETGCYERYRQDFNPKDEEVLKSWGNRRKNGPFDIMVKEGVTYLAKEVELIGKRRVFALYKLLKGLFPKVFKWQERTIMEADRVGYIDLPFGFRRWFWAAGEPKYDSYGKVLGVKKGEQAETSLAYPVAGNAFCHLREGLIILSGLREVEENVSWDRMVELCRMEGNPLEEGRLCNQVHDDLRFEAPEEKWKEIVFGKVLPVMERKSTLLKNNVMPDGFWCKMDVKVGKNMRDMEEAKL